MARVPRAYHLGRRATQVGETRRRVLAAASDRFQQDGYAATTIPAVATAADVSVPTIEAHFGSKANLLKECIDVAIAGDDEPVSVLDRGWTRPAQTATDPGDLLNAVVNVVGPAQQRSAGLVLAAFEGACTDVNLEAVASQMVQQRHATATWIVRTLAAITPLRGSESDAVDTLWMLMEPAIYHRFVHRLGWDLHRYQRWFADSARHLLVPDYPPEEDPTMTQTPHLDPRPGALAYLQLPTTDLAASIAFYTEVFGWRGVEEYGSFEAHGLTGQWTTDLGPAHDGGPVLWLTAGGLYAALSRVVAHGGRVRRSPYLDQGARWLAEIDDPSGNRLGIVVRAGTGRPQTMLMVRDVQVSSRWYQEVLGLTSDHGGPEYERLLSDGDLVIQLHHERTDHHHGPVGEPSLPRGNGVLVWFGEVTDFDGIVERVARLGVEVVKEPHRNPPEGDGNGPGHREIWVKDPDGYVVAAASPDGEAWER